MLLQSCRHAAPLKLSLYSSAAEEMVGDIAQAAEFSPRENIRSFYRVVMGVMPGLAAADSREAEPQRENVFSRTL